MNKSGPQTSKSPSQLIDARIKELGDWRGKMLSRLRALIKEADPEVVEEWKWRGVPVWSHDGLICTGETYKSIVKLTFAKGASLEDPSRLFNASLAGNTRRAIDLHAGDDIDADAFKTLIRAAVARDLFRATAARMSVLKASASMSSPAWRSIARRVLPARLALNRREGSSSEAPLAKVSFTMLLYVSPVQISPS